MINSILRIISNGLELWKRKKERDRYWREFELEQANLRKVLKEKLNGIDERSKDEKSRKRAMDSYGDTSDKLPKQSPKS